MGSDSDGMRPFEVQARPKHKSHRLNRRIACFQALKGSRKIRRARLHQEVHDTLPLKNADLKDNHANLLGLRTNGKAHRVERRRIVYSSRLEKRMMRVVWLPEEWIIGGWRE